LALKAFLRAHDLPILTARKSHKLSDLYRESRDLGLVIGPNDSFEIGNIVSLLDSANKYQGIRYFSLESGVTADLLRLREVTAELMRAVEPHIDARLQQDNLPLSRAAKVTVVFPKPRPKKKLEFRAELTPCRFPESSSSILVVRVCFSVLCR
jgi:hypothetical protein